MAKISIEDLKRIKEEQRGKMVLRDGSYRAKITVHMGTCGIAAGARDVMGAFRELIAEKDLTDVIITNSGCAGLCSKEPMVTVELSDQSPVKYILVDKAKAARIFNEHVMQGKAVEEFALARGSETTAT
ncbi:(2Fe-2S) ferredoxin domain-containing protein [Desulfomonile tiedjei]|uniref:Ferredoxin n=1 Tax=Desulfomonile tiedjei (strain ATCC 49306 / DSM 6799 / DCB-1) TaxID=706587 RepID=I4C787_DESTA|nr:(2Fe-2S) ferredoxin domain-containing protein [Desulfomonile tiedjei]AFM25428.1 ferredoxin [Desulfomonile tiedjei DSM 6799]